MLVDWDNVTLMTMFWWELKNNVKDELIRDSTAHNNLNILIKQSININDKLYKQVMKKKHDDSNTDRSEIYTERINKKNKESYYKTPDLYEHKPMKLNMIKKKKSWFEKSKFKEKQKSMTCYACDKSDYIARNC